MVLVCRCSERREVTEVPGEELMLELVVLSPAPLDSLDFLISLASWKIKILNN